MKDDVGYYYAPEPPDECPNCDGEGCSRCQDDGGHADWLYDILRDHELREEATV